MSVSARGLKFAPDPEPNQTLPVTKADARRDALLTWLPSVSPHCSMLMPTEADLASGMVPTVQWIKISQLAIK